MKYHLQRRNLEVMRTTPRCRPTPPTIPFLAILAVVILALAAVPSFAAQAGSKTAAEAKAVPVIDAAAGSCSADFTITDNAGAPLYAANIQVHIAYGFMYLRKLDLEVGTNTDGKARFVGLPERTKNGLFFRASQGDREGSAFDDPANTCKAQFTIALQKKTP